MGLGQISRWCFSTSPTTGPLRYRSAGAATWSTKPPVLLKRTVGLQAVATSPPVEEARLIPPCTRPNDTEVRRPRMLHILTRLSSCADCNAVMVLELRAGGPARDWGLHWAAHGAQC